jgi:hypothetical protein
MFKDFGEYYIEVYLWKPFIKIHYADHLNKIFLAGWPRIGEERDRKFIWINRLKT